MTGKAISTRGSILLLGLLFFIAVRTQSQESGPQIAGVQPEIKALVNRQYTSLLELYRYLHANPELSFQEIKTAERIQRELRSSGFQVTGNVGGHGLVGILKNGEGPTVMIRADLDGLPVTEETGLEYASQVRVKDDQNREVGVMHACGHDIHMTCFIGTARLLSQMKDRWQGTLLMVGQPAEERSAGARAMLADDLYQKFPRPDYALALHSDAGLEAGKVGICEGAALAGTDTINLTIRGISGHGAYPYMTRDPVVLSAQIVLALQTIVSREIRAIDPAVVTVGSIHGGTKHNIIPDEVQLQLTSRYYSDAVRTRILESIERIAKGIAQAGGVPKDREPIMRLVEAESIPPVYNNPDLTRRCTRAIGAVLGKENTVMVEPVMGGEDFGVFGRTAEKISIFLFWVGTVSRERMVEIQKEGAKPLPSLHSSLFAPSPESTIKTGTKAMTAAALDLFQQRVMDESEER